MMEGMSLPAGGRLYVSLALASLVLLTGCKAKEITSEWAPAGLAVDGRTDDWEGFPTTYLEDQAAVVGLANNGERLHVLIRLRDPKYARLIRMTGLKIYFDREAKENKDFYIKFSGGPSAEEMAALMGQSDDGGREAIGMMDRMPRMETDSSLMFTCYIKDRLVEMPISMDGAQGPAAASGVEHGSFVYEFSVPLGETAVRYYGLGMQPGETISIGAVWGEMDRDAMRQRADGGGHGGGGFPGGSGPPGGGGGRGGGRGGMMPGGSRPDMPEKQEIWAKTTLAQEPAETPTETD